MKHGRSAQDVADLAAWLRAARVEGLPVSAWLNQYHERLQLLVPLGWTWDQLADAMNAAGIRYKAGKPLPAGGMSRGCWTGRQLRNVVRRTRAQDTKRRAATQEVLATTLPRTLPPVLPVSHEVIQRATSDAGPVVPRSVVKVFGAPGAEPAPQSSPASLVGRIGQLAGPHLVLPGEPGTLERQAAAKAAETQRIVSSFLHRRRQGHDQKS